MSGTDAIMVPLTVTLVICVVLLAGKLIAMLLGGKPYWIRREGLIDKTARPAVHAFYAGVFAFALVAAVRLLLPVSLGSAPRLGSQMRALTAW